MAKALGTWLLGDKLKDLIYHVKNPDGTYKDLTGHTVKLEGRRYGDHALSIDVTGTVDPDQVTVGSTPSTTTRGKVTFSDITTGITLAKRSQTFEARVRVTLTAGSLPGWTKPFDITVEQWP